MLDHPNIIKLYDVFEDFRFIYLVQELCQGGEAFHLVMDEGPLDEKDAAAITKQLLSAVAYSHDQLVIHRDLKLENMLVETIDRELVIKLIDFGSSAILSSPTERLKVLMGTHSYIAPEVYYSDYSLKSDMWPIGVIVYEMLSGTCPFHGKTDEQIIRNVKAARFNFLCKFLKITIIEDIWEKRSKESKDFITSLITLDEK